MCCCGKPVKNGEQGYSWDGKTHGVYPPNPPTLGEGEILVYDEPGRCGGVDSHCHHFRVVKARWGGLELLVRHGGGDERFKLGSQIAKALDVLDSNKRYWVLQTLYHAQHYSAQSAKDGEAARWRTAAAEKRIRTRKVRGQGQVRVWIEEGS